MNVSINEHDKKLYTATQRNQFIIISVLVGALVTFAIMSIINATRPDPAQTTTTVTVTHEATGHPTQSPTTPTATLDSAELARLDTNDPLASGSVDAPVVMIEYFDYQCGYCNRLALETLPVLQEEYVDSGLLRIEFRDYPALGVESVDAAAAGRAAARQGKYHEFVEAVARHNLGSQNPERLTHDVLTGLAEEAGVTDIDKFSQDMNDPEIIQAVTDDHGEARALGLTGVPTLIIGDQVISGFVEADALRPVIDAQLDQAGAPR